MVLIPYKGRPHKGKETLLKENIIREAAKKLEERGGGLNGCATKKRIFFAASLNDSYINFFYCAKLALKQDYC